MADVVINAFGGEGTLFTRTFLTAYPAWSWDTPQNYDLYLRWIDLANAVGNNADTDAGKTDRILKIYDQTVSELAATVFSVPRLHCDTLQLPESAAKLSNAYNAHPNRSLLALAFTNAEQEADHSKGFQGDPCAGTVCLRGGGSPLPEHYFEPKNVNGMVLTDIKTWITVGGFRGGGTATTLVPLEAEERIKQNQVTGATSVLVAALPYSKHEDDPNDSVHPQLKSDYAFCGSKAILSGDFDIAKWNKRYFVSSYLSGGTVYRPVTAGFSVDDQNTMLIAPNLLTADCCFRAINNKDTSFDNSNVFLPFVANQISNGFGYHLCIDIKKMRAVCWFSGLMKELIGRWDLHNESAKRSAEDKQKVENLKTYCEQVIASFEELQKGRCSGTDALPFRFMPDSFFVNFKKQYNSKDWWETLAKGVEKEEPFEQGLLSKFKQNSVSTKFLSPRLESKEPIDAVLKKIFDEILKSTEGWTYSKKNGSNEDGGMRPMFPLGAAIGSEYLQFGTKLDNGQTTSVMGAVAGEADKVNWDGFIGGPSGRFNDFEGKLRKASPNDPTVVKYTSLLLSHFLKNLREIPFVCDSEQPVAGSIFEAWANHQGTAPTLDVCSIHNQYLGTYSRCGYFILPTPEDWGEQWKELVGYQFTTEQAPQSVDDIIADLTSFEKQIVYTMLCGIRHYNSANPGAAIQTAGGNTHPNFKDVETLLDMLESKVAGSMQNPSVFPNVACNRIDYLNPVCTFVKNPCNPNKIFAKQLGYYRVDEFNDNGIYAVYPFTALFVKWLDSFAECKLNLRVQFDPSGSGDAQRIDADVEYRREKDGMWEARSFSYPNTSLVKFRNMPAISMVPQFGGYDINNNATAEYCYLWIDRDSNVDAVLPELEAVLPKTGNGARGVCKVLVEGLPAGNQWKLCQKVQKTNGSKTDAVWSYKSTVEKHWWTLVNCNDNTQSYGCLGCNPLMLTADQNSVSIPVEQYQPEEYDLDMYFDFGTANSYMEVMVKDINGSPKGSWESEAFAPHKTEYYLTIDATKLDESDTIVKMHEENLTPIESRSESIPSMVQAYAQLEQASSATFFSDNSQQYTEGRIVYPNKRTLDKLYTYARSSEKTLEEIGFCDQMKVKRSGGGTVVTQQLPLIRWFFMKSFIQNTIAIYYERYHAWPRRLNMNCSYPTADLRQEYQNRLQNFLVNQKLEFMPEAISFACAENENGVQKAQKRTVTIDIGAGTTDIAFCDYDIENNQWQPMQIASLRFAGENIVEQSLVEALCIDKVPIQQVFRGLDPATTSVLAGLIEDVKYRRSLIIQIRNLINNKNLQPPSGLDEHVRIRMILRTIALLLVVKSAVPADWNSYELYVHGGPITSLRNMDLSFGMTFENIVYAIFGQRPYWDSNKNAIVRGMSNSLTAKTRISKNVRIANLSDQGIATVFDQNDTPGNHNISFDAYDPKEFVEQVLRVLANIAPDAELPRNVPYNNIAKDTALRSLIAGAQNAQKTQKLEIQNAVTDCEYYKEMSENLIGAYDLDWALRSLPLW